MTVALYRGTLTGCRNGRVTWSLIPPSARSLELFPPGPQSTVPWASPEGCQQCQVLWVDISSDLSWNVHVDRVATAAYKTLGFIRRNIETKSSRVRAMAYQSIVCSHLEYASPVWGPHTKEQTHKIEMVQSGAARWTIND